MKGGIVMMRNIVIKIIGTIIYSCGYVVGFVKGIHKGATNTIRTH